MKNPNTYDDTRYQKARVEVDTAIGELWESGADRAEVEDELAEAIENASGQPVIVAVTPS